MESPEEKFEPGAARLGNFINYYSFHGTENRADSVPFSNLGLDQMEKLVALDVGCNTGELTELLRLKMNADCDFLAVDIDPVLIERAKEPSRPFLTFVAGDITCPTFVQNTLLPFLETHSKSKFDVSFLFSVTMWIHLNVGDDKFTETLVNISKLSRFIVVEPQPWKCYKNAARRLKRAKLPEFKLFNQIKMRETIEEDIDSILTQKCGCVKIYESERSEWRRKIVVYRS